MYLLPPKTVAETKLVTFDFSDDAAPATTLTNPTVTKTLLAGTDTNAAALTITQIMVAGHTVTALVGGGVEGSEYRLLAKAEASNLEIHELAARLIVRASAA